MQLSFFPVEVSYRVVNGSPVVFIYGRAVDGSQICVIDESFEPYFWILGEDKSSAEKISAVKFGREINVKRVEIHAKKFKGKEVPALKVFTFLPGDVPALREPAAAIGPVLEADILFTRRFLIDKGIVPLSKCLAEGEFISNYKSRVPVFRADSIVQSGEETLSSVKVLAFDIETHSPFGAAISPDEQPIIMIAFASEGFKKVVTWKRFKTELDYVEFVDSELELIERFKQVINEFGPDVLAGYFSDGFDLKFLEARAEKYKIALDIGLDFSQVKSVGKQESVEIAGIAHVDIFMFVKKVFGRTMETTSYDLNSVATEILGEGKEKVQLSELYDAWNNNDGLESFCKYNLQDSVLTLRVTEKLLPNIIELVKVVGLPLFDVDRLSFSQLVEWFLIKEAFSFNELAPNRPAYVETRQRLENTYEGAFVFEPTPGLYRDVVVFDFRSLYPTIISAHNISPETINCDCCVMEDAIPGNKRWVCRKKKGFISTVIETLIKRRMRIKEIMKTAENPGMLKARQEALKTIANSVYGYMGFFGARWYSLDAARSITAIGRNYITGVIQKAEDAGFKVLYSDTDSIFLSLSGKERKDAEQFVADINKSLPGLMELDYEGFYPSALFVATKDKGFGAKKKYALISEDGLIKIKGFETVRRNLSAVSKEVQERVIGIILRDNDPDKALEYVKGMISKIRQREVPLEKVVISTQLQKEISSYDAISPHVAVAQKMKQMGKRVGVGSVISYVVVAGKDKIRDRARLISEVKEGDYDSEYYLFNQVMPAVEKIFAVFDINVMDYVEPKTQSKLDSFFS